MELKHTKKRGKAKHQSILYGTLILTVATGLAKVIGALFKIPLGRFLLDGEGMGYFSAAYELYLPMYAISMAGLPIAISRMVATSIGEGRYRDVRAIQRVARRAFLVTGLIGFVVMLAGSVPYILFIKDGDFSSIYCILAIAPALLFCCVMSSYRGYYEGLRNMYPTAVSEIIDVGGKLVFGIIGAFAIIQIGLAQFKSTGVVFGQAMEGAASSEVLKMLQPYAAAGAVLGVTAGSALGALFLVLRHRIVGDHITAQQLVASPEQTPSRQILKSMLIIAFPIVIGALANNISSLIDVLTVQQRLESVVAVHGDEIYAMYGASLDGVNKVPDFLFGCYKGYSYSFYNLVPTIASVIGISALPAVATAWSGRDRAESKKSMESVIRMTALISFPGGIGLSLLSHPIMQLVFGAGRAGEAQIAGDLLTIQGITAIFAGLTLPLNSMLQALGKEKIPMFNILIGSVIKISLNWYLVGLPQYNVKGAVVGSLACYVFMFVSDLFFLCKSSKIIPNVWSTLVKPLIGAVLCGATAFVTYNGLARVISGNLATVASLCAAVVVYVLAIGLMRVMSREEVETLPKGDKIAGLLDKMHFLA